MSYPITYFVPERYPLDLRFRWWQPGRIELGGRGYGGGYFAKVSRFRNGQESHISYQNCVHASNPAASTTAKRSSMML